MWAGSGMSDGWPSPIALPIAARAPWEVAVAVAGEIVAA